MGIAGRHGGAELAPVPELYCDVRAAYDMRIRHDSAMAGPDHAGPVPVASGTNQDRRAAKLFRDRAETLNGHVIRLRGRGRRPKWTHPGRRLLGQSWH